MDEQQQQQDLTQVLPIPPAAPPKLTPEQIAATQSYFAARPEESMPAHLQVKIAEAQAESQAG